MHEKFYYRKTNNILKRFRGLCIVKTELKRATQAEFGKNMRRNTKMKRTIAVLLAIVFKESIGKLIQNLLKTIEGNATGVVNNQIPQQ